MFEIPDIDNLQNYSQEVNQQVLSYAVKNDRLNLAQLSLYLGANPNGKGPYISSTMKTPGKICNDEALGKIAKNDPGLLWPIMLSAESSVCYTLKSNMQDLMADLYFGAEKLFHSYFGLQSAKKLSGGAYVSKWTNSFYFPASYHDTGFAYATLAVHVIKEWQPDMLKLLVKYGADINYLGGGQTFTPLAEYVGEDKVKRICDAKLVLIRTCEDEDWGIWSVPTCCPSTDKTAANSQERKSEEL